MYHPVYSDFNKLYITDDQCFSLPSVSLTPLTVTIFPLCPCHHPISTNINIHAISPPPTPLQSLQSILFKNRSCQLQSARQKLQLHFYKLIQYFVAV